MATMHFLRDRGTVDSTMAMYRDSPRTAIVCSMTFWRIP